MSELAREPSNTALSPQVAEEPVEPGDPPATRRGLHQPVRAVVAVAELLVAGLAILAAVWWLWPKGVYTVVTVLDDGTRFESTRNVGHWIALVIALGAVAGVLVLDAVRQAVLAVRARPLRGHSKHAAHS